MIARNICRNAIQPCSTASSPSSSARASARALQPADRAGSPCVAGGSSPTGTRTRRPDPCSPASRLATKARWSAATRVVVLPERGRPPPPGRGARRRSGRRGRRPTRRRTRRSSRPARRRCAPAPARPRPSRFLHPRAYGGQAAAVTLVDRWVRAAILSATKCRVAADAGEDHRAERVLEAQPAEEQPGGVGGDAAVAPAASRPRRGSGSRIQSKTWRKPVAQTTVATSRGTPSTTGRPLADLLDAGR